MEHNEVEQEAAWISANPEALVHRAAEICGTTPA